MTRLVVVGCGKRKLSAPAPAVELYTGGYFRAVLAYARTLTLDTRILVLSAKYGLIRGSRVIEPYDLKMGQPGSVTVEQVTAQAHLLGVANATDVVGLVGETGGYAARVRAVWPHAQFPLSGLPGRMGGRKTWLMEHTKGVVRA